MSPILSSIAVLAFSAATFPVTAFCANHPSTVAEVVARAEKHEPLSIVFLGGSLTWGANASDPNTTSYRGQMMRWLRERYPLTPLNFHDAAIGGTGSDLALFRIDRDVLPHHPDLVFLDFTVNDDISTVDPVRMATYERILRDMRLSGAAVIPVLMCMRGHLEAPLGTPVPARYQAHQKLAETYGLIAADTLLTARAAIAAGKVTLNSLYPVEGDSTHPGDAGYRLFFEAARDAWLKAAALDTPAVIPDTTCGPDAFPRRERRILVDKPLPVGWSRWITYRTSMWFDGLSSRWMGDVVCAAGADAMPLEATFNGSFIGIFGERNPLTAPFRVWIDGQPVSQPRSSAADPFLWNISTAHFASKSAGAGNLFAWIVLAQNLKDGEHVLKIAPDFAGASPSAELRIESLCSAGRY